METQTFNIIAYCLISVIGGLACGALVFYRKKILQELKIRKARKRYIKVVKHSKSFVVLSMDDFTPNADGPKKHAANLFIYEYNLSGEMLLGILDSAKQCVELAIAGHLNNIDNALDDAGIGKN